MKWEVGGCTCSCASKYHHVKRVMLVVAHKASWNKNIMWPKKKKTNTAPHDPTTRNKDGDQYCTWIFHILKCKITNSWLNSFVRAYIFQDWLYITAKRNVSRQVFGSKRDYKNMYFFMQHVNIILLANRRYCRKKYICAIMTRFAKPEKYTRNKNNDKKHVTGSLHNNFSSLLKKKKMPRVSCVAC